MVALWVVEAIYKAGSMLWHTALNVQSAFQRIMSEFAFSIFIAQYTPDEELCDRLMSQWRNTLIAWHYLCIPQLMARLHYREITTSKPLLDFWQSDSYLSTVLELERQSRDMKHEPINWKNEIIKVLEGAFCPWTRWMPIPPPSKAINITLEVWNQWGNLNAQHDGSIESITEAVIKRARAQAEVLRHLNPDFDPAPLNPLEPFYWASLKASTVAWTTYRELQKAGILADFPQPWIKGMMSHLYLDSDLYDSQPIGWDGYARYSVPLSHIEATTPEQVTIKVQDLSCTQVVEIIEWPDMTWDMYLTWPSPTPCHTRYYTPYEISLMFKPHDEDLTIHYYLRAPSQCEGHWEVDMDIWNFPLYTIVMLRTYGILSHHNLIHLLGHTIHLRPTIYGNSPMVKFRYDKITKEVTILQTAYFDLNDIYPS